MPVQGKTRRDVITEFRQTEILTAARKVFAEKGFSEATLDAIAAYAGIAKGTLYLYFDNKEDLFYAAVEGCMRTLLDETRRAVEQPGSARERLEKAIRVRFDFMRRNEDFLRIYYTQFGALCSLGGQHRPQFRELYFEGARPLAGVIEEGVKQGEIRDLPPLETAMALMEIARGTIGQHLLGLHERSFDLEPFVFDIFWRGVGREGTQ